MTDNELIAIATGCWILGTILIALMARARGYRVGFRAGELTERHRISTKRKLVNAADLERGI